jgi:peptidoglycan hydrolase-like protein with peptidoglycan-binding domain
MFLASKTAWAGIVLILLTTGISAPPPTPLASGPILSKEGSAVWDRTDVKKMQEDLRNRGHYRGKVDGVFGLRTQASIRAYQKAQNLPITGQVDTRTADRLGVKPESNWGDSKNAGREAGHVSGGSAGAIKTEKPSAGIRKAEVKANKIWRKEVSRTTALEDNRGVGANKQQAEKENHDQ